MCFGEKMGNPWEKRVKVPKKRGRNSKKRGRIAKKRMNFGVKRVRFCWKKVNKSPASTGLLLFIDTVEPICQESVCYLRKCAQDLKKKAKIF